MCHQWKCALVKVYFLILLTACEVVCICMCCLHTESKPENFHLTQRQALSLDCPYNRRLLTVVVAPLLPLHLFLHKAA